MQAHILSLHTPLALGWGQEVKTVALSESSHVVYHYQIKGMKHRAPCKHTICPYTKHSAPVVGSKGQIFFFLKNVMLLIELKGKEQRANASTYSDFNHTIDPPLPKGQFVLLKVVIVHIKLSN